MKSLTCFILVYIIPFVQPLAAQSADSSRGHFPLQVGNLWQYYTFDYRDGKVIYTYGWTQRVIGDTLLPDGKKYAVMQLDLPNTTLGYYRQEGSLVQIDTPIHYGQKTIYDFSKTYGDTLFVYPRSHDSKICVVTFNDYLSVFGLRRLAWDFHTYSSNTSSFLTQTVVDGFGVIEEKAEAGEEWFLRGAIIDGVKYGTVTSVTEQAPYLHPNTFNLLSNFPNPFNSSTTITFEFSSRQFIDVSVYDILGRKVRSLVNTNMPSGFHRVVWNGKDDLGRDQPSGIYVVRLACEVGSEQIKILMVK